MPAQPGEVAHRVQAMHGQLQIGAQARSIRLKKRHCKAWFSEKPSGMSTRTPSARNTPCVDGTPPMAVGKRRARNFALNSG